MDFSIFIFLTLLVLWLIDSFINQCVQLLLKMGRAIRTLIIVIVIVFGIGVITDPILTAEIVKDLFQVFTFIGRFMIDVILSIYQAVLEAIE